MVIKKEYKAAGLSTPTNDRLVPSHNILMRILIYKYID